MGACCVDIDVQCDDALILKCLSDGEIGGKLAVLMCWWIVGRVIKRLKIEN